MDALEESILAVADLTLEGQALSRAALDQDFDEARFRASVMAEIATGSGYARVAAAAANVLERLGPSGARPKEGYAEAILKVASAIDVLWFDQR